MAKIPRQKKSNSTCKPAEKMLPEKNKDFQEKLPEALKKLIEELQTRHNNLEMQNAELRKIQLKIEESRTKYIDLYDSAPVGYFSFNQEGLIVEVNLTGALLLGFDKHLLINKPFFRFVAPEFQNPFLSHLKKVFTSGSKLTCELKFIKKDGTPFYSLMESIAVLDNERNFIQCRSVVSDITERKRMEENLRTRNEFLEQNVAERTKTLAKTNEKLLLGIVERKGTKEALQKSEARLAEAQQIAHIGNWEWDLVKNQAYWSDEIYRIFGLVPQQFVATYEAFLNYIHPDDRDFVKKSITDALDEKKPYDIDYRILLKDAQVRIVHAKAVVTFNASGKAIRIAGTIQDITDRKRAEEEVNLLQTITMAIAESKNFHSALSIVLRKVCETTGWIYGEAWLPSPDGKYLECCQAWHRNPEKSEEFRKKSKEFTFPPGVGLLGRVWSLKKPVWKRDATVDGDLFRAQFIKDSGFTSGMGIPVLANDKVIAVLDFLVHDQREEDERLVRLVSSVAMQLGSLIQRKQAEDALRESEERLQSILDNTTAVVYVKDIHGRYTFVNKQYEKLFHVKRDEIKGKTCFDLFPHGIADVFQANDQRIIETNAPLKFEEIAPLEDGFHTFISIRFPLHDSTGTMYAVCGISTDITERKQMEEEREKLREQLFHSKRLESVGKLAGAIAHDFNNILSGIIGYGELLLGKVKEDIVSKDYVQKLLTTADRATSLIQGLLTFSRKKIPDLKPVNLNNLIKKAENLLSKLIHKNIEFRTALTDRNCVVIADSGQIEQVLMNLTTNARDAMPDGGLLSLDTNVVDIDNEFIKTHGYGEIGQYARISFSDTGVGMDEETKKKIFEPFFTTKKAGKGTGLGLSIVYAIVKQHRGYINVFSEPKKGTRFDIYLPLIESLVEEGKPKAVTVPVGGTETILLAEDDEDVRELTRRVLVGAGYRVIDAVDGEDAIDKFMKNKDRIQLLLFDVMMPKKNGKEAHDEIKKTRQDIKTLFMSGYSEDVINNKIIFDENLHFLPKPVLQTVLLRKIREVLDSSPPCNLISDAASLR